jgi:hypothetical protein
MEFQATDAYSSLGYTKVVYKAQRLSIVEREEII